MSVEPLLTGTAALVSLVAPPVFMGGFKANGVVAFFGAIIAANTISEIVFRLAKPDFHYGPLYGLGMVMNAGMTLIIAGFSVAVTAIVLSLIDLERQQR